MSVVVVGLQHTQAPLPLLEAAAVPDEDLHKVLSSLSHRRNVLETVVLSTCLRTEVYAVVDRFHDAVAEIYDVLVEQSGASVEALSAPRRRSASTTTSPPISSLSPRASSRWCTGRAKWSARSAGPSSGRRKKASAGRSSPPCSATRCRPASGCGPRPASQGHDLLRLRRRDRGPRPRAAAACAGQAVVVVGAGAMGLGVSRALCDIPGGRRAGSVVVVNRSLGRAQDLVRRPKGAAFSLRAAALDDGRGRAGPGRRGAHGRGGGVARARRRPTSPAWPGPCWSSTWACPATSTRRAASWPAVTLLDMDTLRDSVAAGAGRPGRGVGGGPGHRRPRRWSVTARPAASVGPPPSWRPAGPPRVVAGGRARAPPGPVGRSDRGRVGARRRRPPGPPWPSCCTSPPSLLKETAGTPQGERLVEALRILFDL